VAQVPPFRPFCVNPANSFFVRNPANKQTNADESITSLAEVTRVHDPTLALSSSPSAQREHWFQWAWSRAMVKVVM